MRTEGVEPSPRFQDQILSLARLPIPPRSPRKGQFLGQFPDPRVWIVSRPTDHSPRLNLCLYRAGYASPQKCIFPFRATFHIINEGSETTLPLEGLWDRPNPSVELISRDPLTTEFPLLSQQSGPTVGPGSREADISDQPSNQLRSKTRDSTAGAPSNRPERVGLLPCPVMSCPVMS